MTSSMSTNTRQTTEENSQEDYCGEEESEVDIVMETGGREGEGVMLHADKKVECERNHRNISVVKR